MSGATYRHDPFTDAWRIVSPGRAATPQSESAGPLLPDPAGPCPFCPGGGRSEEPVLAAWPSLADAEIRVIENAYPVVQGTVEAVEVPGGNARTATGWHEVVIEGREHEGDVPTLRPELWRAAVRTYRDRARELGQRPGIKQVHLFRNRGRPAGSSQPHPHSQIVATTVLGKMQRRRVELARSTYRREGRSLLAQALERAELGERAVMSSEVATVFCPFAPRYNFETWVAPKAPAPFVDLDDASADAFADTLQKAIACVQNVSGYQAYNLLWHLPPSRPAAEPWAFWFVEIAPRGGPGAGIELLSGMSLVSMPPEIAAERLRDA